MRLPIVRVRDNSDGREFVVTDSSPHNYLYADEKGMHYYNLQNGEGTGKHGDYCFVGEKGYMGTDIPMLDMKEILGLYHQNMIKPFNNNDLDFEFDKMLAAFIVLDMYVKGKQEERQKQWDEMIRKSFDDYFANESEPQEDL